MSLISIITVDYNQPEATLALIKSIDLHYSSANIEIIVVDNGSIENKGSILLQQNKDVKFIRSEENLGFAAGNNLGIKAAAGEYLFFVNNDTEFTAGLIECLVETLKSDATIGIISPKINYYDEPEVIQYAGFTEMNYYTCRNKCIGQFELDQGQFDKLSSSTGFIHGAAMMITRTALLAAGVMPENFFLYFEEMDWCERIKKAGFKIWVNGHATIYHKESLSVGKNSSLKEYFMNRNRILFIRRNAANAQKIIFYIYFIAIVTPRNIISYFKAHNSSFISVLFRAIKWNLTNTTSSPTLGYSKN
jgi:GT2 family glycosyltransferase